jgi:hypothetical protein
MTEKLVNILLVFTILVAAGIGFFIGLNVGDPALAEPGVVVDFTAGTTNLDSLELSEDLSVGDDTTLTDDVSVGGDLAVTGSYDASADIDVGTWFNLSAQSIVTITAGESITPTGTYQPIGSASAVTTSTSIPIVAGSEIGDLLVLRNVNGSNAITVDGTGGNVECKANVAIGASDTLFLVWTGSAWHCLSSYDNS